MPIDVHRLEHFPREMTLGADDKRDSHDLMHAKEKKIHCN